MEYLEKYPFMQVWYSILVLFITNFEHFFQYSVWAHFHGFDVVFFLILENQVYACSTANTWMWNNVRMHQ